MNQEKQARKALKRLVKLNRRIDQGKLIRNKDDKLIKNKGKYIKFVARKTCGCCMAEMFFKDSAAASAAFKRAGLNCWATVTDDMGTAHPDIDTFYGFSKWTNTLNNDKPLLTLAKRAGII